MYVTKLPPTTVTIWINVAVLKDVPQYPLEMLKQRSEESTRMQLFPNLDYNGLFNVVVQLIDVTPIVQLGVQGIDSMMSYLS